MERLRFVVERGTRLNVNEGQPDSIKQRLEIIRGIAVKGLSDGVDRATGRPPGVKHATSGFIEPISSADIGQLEETPSRLGDR